MGNPTNAANPLSEYSWFRVGEKAGFPTDNEMATSKQKAQFLQAVTEARSSGEIINNRQSYLEAIDGYEEKTLIHQQTKVSGAGPKSLVLEDPETKELTVTHVTILPETNASGQPVLRVIEDKYSGASDGAINFSERRELDHEAIYHVKGWRTSNMARDIKLDFNGDGTADERIIHHRTLWRDQASVEEHHIDTNQDGKMDFHVITRSDTAVVTHIPWTPNTLRVLTHTAQENPEGIITGLTWPKDEFYEGNLQRENTGYDNGIRE